jgi:protein TonB
MNLSSLDPSQKDTKRSGLHINGATYLPEEDGDDRRVLRWSLAVAAVVHAIFLLMTFTETQAEVEEVGRPSTAAYVLKPVSFKPPPPRQEKIQPKKPKAKKIPMPDPTPDDPEPIVEDVVLELVESDAPESDFAVDIPSNGPPGFGAPGVGEIADIGGAVLPPKAIYSPKPHYTEEARQARVQGMVLLETIIDTQGNVAAVRILKGLPMGLTESAIETVKTWKYQPSTRNGKPVAVRMHLNVGFWLQ